MHPLVPTPRDEKVSVVRPADRAGSPTGGVPGVATWVMTRPGLTPYFRCHFEDTSTSGQRARGAAGNLHRITKEVK